jgi:hypothetical protein
MAAAAAARRAHPLNRPAPDPAAARAPAPRPSPMQPPPAPLWLGGGDAASAAPKAAAAAPGKEEVDEDEAWVEAQLLADGEDLVARLKAADRLLAALICLAEPLGLATTAPQEGAAGGGEAGGGGGGGGGEVGGEARLPPAPGGLGAWPWWAARALALQQQALTGRSASVRRALLAASGAAVAWADGLRSSGGGGGVGGEAAALLAAGARLEAARAQQAYGDVNAARRQLEAAGAALGLEVQRRGAVER